MNTNTANQRKSLFLFLVFFLPVMCFVFWKCPYGFGDIDESFYLTVPYRLLQGDALFQEEWHLSQMAGVLTMPIVSLYLKWNGSTEGILLAMRYVCTFIQCICAVFLYLRLRRIHPLGAILASVSFLLYTPFSIMALSYNSMGILFLTVALVLILTAQKKVHLQYCFAGLLFAAAVLCCPYLLLVYILYLVAVAVAVSRQKRNAVFPSEPFLSVKSAFFFTAGAACAAAAFSVFVLTRGSIRGIVLSLEPIFNDPEHLPVPLAIQPVNFLLYIFLANEWTPVLYILLFILGIAARKYPQHKPLITCLITVLVLALQYSFFQLNNYINHLMWSVNILAGLMVLMTANPMIHRLFFTVWVPGILYAYCLNLTSNQEFYAISSASSVSAVASIIIICLFAEELLQDKERVACKKLAVSLICIFFAMQLSTQAVMRYRLIFWDGSMQEMTTEITDGIEKGICTTESNAQQYYEKLGYLDQLSEYAGESVLYLSQNTWYYLQNENRFSTFSAWLSGVNVHSIDKLEVYYQINPHKLPRAVFADEQHEEYAIMFSQRFPYTLQQIHGGYLLLPE